MEFGKTFEEIGRTIDDLSARLEKLEAWKRQVEAHPELPEIIDSVVIQDFLHVKPSQAYAIMNSRKLKTFRLGRYIKATKADFLQFLADGGDGYLERKAKEA